MGTHLSNDAQFIVHTIALEMTTLVDISLAQVFVSMTVVEQVGYDSGISPSFLVMLSEGDHVPSNLRHLDIEIEAKGT